MPEEEKPTTETESRSVPFFLRVVAVLIFVTGSVGVLFYLFVAGFQLSGRNLLYSPEYKGYSGLAWYSILVIQILLNGGLVLSAILLLKLRRTGMYIFGISFIIMVAINYVLHDQYIWAIPVAGVFLFIVIWLYRKRLSN